MWVYVRYIYSFGHAVVPGKTQIEHITNGEGGVPFMQVFLAYSVQGGFGECQLHTGFLC